MEAGSTESDVVSSADTLDQATESLSDVDQDSEVGSEDVQMDDEAHVDEDSTGDLAEGTDLTENLDGETRADVEGTDGFNEQEGTDGFNEQETDPENLKEDGASETASTPLPDDAEGSAGFEDEATEPNLDVGASGEAVDEESADTQGFEDSEEQADVEGLEADEQLEDQLDAENVDAQEVPAGETDAEELDSQEHLEVPKAPEELHSAGGPNGHQPLVDKVATAKDEVDVDEFEGEENLDNTHIPEPGYEPLVPLKLDIPSASGQGPEKIPTRKVVHKSPTKEEPKLKKITPGKPDRKVIKKVVARHVTPPAALKNVSSRAAKGHIHALKNTSHGVVKVKSVSKNITKKDLRKQVPKPEPPKAAKHLKTGKSTKKYRHVVHKATTITTTVYSPASEQGFRKVGRWTEKSHIRDWEQEDNKVGDPALDEFGLFNAIGFAHGDVENPGEKSPARIAQVLVLTIDAPQNKARLGPLLAGLDSLGLGSITHAFDGVDAHKYQHEGEEMSQTVIPMTADQQEQWMKVTTGKHNGLMHMTQEGWKSPAKFASNGALACSLGHHQLWEFAAVSDTEDPRAWTVILEDDARIADLKDKSSLQRTLSSAPPDVNIVFLDDRHCKYSEPGVQGKKMDPWAAGSTAYAVTNVGAQILLSEQFLHLADHWLNVPIWKGKMKAYCPDVDQAVFVHEYAHESTLTVDARQRTVLEDDDKDDDNEWD